MHFLPPHCPTGSAPLAVPLAVPHICWWSFNFFTDFSKLNLEVHAIRRQVAAWRHRVHEANYEFPFVGFFILQSLPLRRFSEQFLLKILVKILWRRVIHTHTRTLRWLSRPIVGHLELWEGWKSSILMGAMWSAKLRSRSCMIVFLIFLHQIDS